MDVKIILDTAKQFLVTPQGQKLLKKINIEQVDKVIEAIRAADEEGKFDKSTKNAQERKTEREISRQEAIDDAKIKAGEELAKYEPFIQIFTTKGRVYDKQTKEPIQGIEVIPQLCVFPVSSNPSIYEDAIRKNRITKENLVDKEGNVLLQAVRDKDLRDPRNSNVQVKNENNFYVKTDENGEFEVSIGLPILDIQPNRIIADTKVQPFFYYKDEFDQPQTDSQRKELEEGKFEGSQYAPSVQIITTQAGEVPQELNIHSLLNINKASQIAKDEAIEEINNFVISKVDPVLDLAETFLVNLRNSVLKPATVVQNIMLPLAFQLMIYFGIAKQEQANQLQSKCPSNERLKFIVSKRNSVVRQLNNIYGIIAANTALAFLFVYLSSFLKGISATINSLPIPLQFTTYNVTSRLDNIQDMLDKLSDVNKELKKQLIIALIFLIISLIIILRYLKTIDKLIEGCENVENLEQLNAELLALSAQDATQGEPEKLIVNGFNMSVEVVDKAQVGELPRRQAIAKNSKGITILKGEPSFSAEDQILIDELAFYIQINNLKAD